jgi:hypothetical protein
VRVTNRIYATAVIAVAWVQLPPAASAQSDAALIEAVRACQRVGAGAARLACYDRALPPLDESIAGDEASARPGTEPPPTNAAPPPVETDRASRERSGGGDEPEVAGTVTIIEVRSLRPGAARFLAADGRLFVQRGRSFLRLPDPPFEAELESGALGSTFFKLEQGLRIRVEESE